YVLALNRRPQRNRQHLEALWELKDRYLARFAIYNVFSREAQEVDLFNGRIDAAKARAFLEALILVETIDEAFVCGPASMIDEVEGALLAAGVPRSHVHVERFGVPGAVPQPVDDADAAEARVTLVVDGVRREVDFHRGQHSILEAGRAAGIDLPFSCKGGMCSTCRAKLLEGEVKMAKNYALEPHEVAAGYVLTCQSYPLTERVVISFDDR
ncbi:MAG: 2Fe-2S iron-sulfur cluster-binding protein, partial [Comamonadaceae bacterium]|nr:2Fe-2S iron-sulfur cluster-binding protein [Comamonadaceae bacterium]